MAKTLQQAIADSPYNTAIAERGSRTYIVEPQEADEENLEGYVLKLQDGAMPPSDYRSYGGLSALMRGLSNWPQEPQADEECWLSIGEGGEVLDEDAATDAQA